VVLNDGDHVNLAAWREFRGVYVTDVGDPILVTSFGGEGHLFRSSFSATLRFRKAVDTTVFGHDPPAGGAAQVYAHLLQGGVEAKRAEPGVLLHEPDLIHDGEGHLTAASRSTMRLVLQTPDSLLGPPLQGPVDGGLARLQKPGDALYRPSGGVQLDAGLPALSASGHFVVVGVASDRH